MPHTEGTRGFLDTGVWKNAQLGHSQTWKILQGTLSISLLEFSAVVDLGRDISASWSRAISLETVLRVKFCPGELSCV